MSTLVDQTSRPSLRLVVKFRPGLQLPYDHTIAVRLGKTWERLLEQFPDVTISPLYTTIDPVLLKQFSETVISVQNRRFSFTSYYVIQFPAGISGVDLLNAVSSWDSVENAYIQAGGAPPPGTVAQNPLLIQQGFHSPASLGIDSEWAWHEKAINGSGIGFIDIEQGWELNHEDLAAAGISLVWGKNRAYSATVRVSSESSGGKTIGSEEWESPTVRSGA